MMKIQKSISLEEKTWKLIDELRISIPRSKYVGEFIDNELLKIEKGGN
ncbi:MAG: hypothetical protein OEM79_05745 [Nitrosopumilus sp.]|nr:hypothetical protein [Nitrosopumilus sp.]